MKPNNIALWSSQAMGVATITTAAVQLEHIFGFAVQLVWTGTPVGNFTIEVSNDMPPAGGVIPSTFAPTNWSTLSGSTKAAGGAAGEHIYNVTDAMYRWFRIKYVGTGSTGSVTARHNLKGV